MRRQPANMLPGDRIRIAGVKSGGDCWKQAILGLRKEVNVMKHIFVLMVVAVVVTTVFAVAAGPTFAARGGSGGGGASSFHQTTGAVLTPSGQHHAFDNRHCHNLGCPSV